MPKFREAREALLHAYSDNLIVDEEFCLLFDLNTSKNPDIEYWNYPPFDLNTYSDDDVLTQFRFMKRDILHLQTALDFPNEITCHFYNDLTVNTTEALCVVLNRLAYPCRYVDMVPIFGRSIPQLSMIFNQTVDLIDSNHGHRLRDMNQNWLNPQSLRAFADSVHTKGAALDNVRGFLDGTVRPCCRPRINQRTIVQWA